MAMLTTAGLRAADYTLEPEQQALFETFSTFFQRQSGSERVRAAEPFGFDEALWRQLGEMRAVAMGVSEEAGGDGAGLVELSLATEPFGKHLAPVPFVEVLVAARLLGLVTPNDAEWLPQVLTGERLVTLALHPAQPGIAQLVPAGAVADAVIGLVGDDLVLATASQKPRAPRTQGYAPIALWDLTATDVITTVLATGAVARDAYRSALREWHLLMASALTGMGSACLDIAVEHAKNRIAFDVPIGTFQAIAHPIVDVANGVEAARRMTRKAAWFEDFEPGASLEFVPMAYRCSERVAVLGARVAVHVLGGVGFTVESDAQLYFRRIKGWTLVAGNPDDTFHAIADHLYGPAGEVAL